MLDNNIKEIKSSCNRLANSNLLVLDNEISVFLSQIAENENLREIIKESNKNYSFSYDWERFQQQRRIALPSSKRHIIAFAVGLLYKIDVKEISSIDMLTTFYYQTADLQQAFFTFTREILDPMQDAFVSLLKGEPISDEDMTNEPVVLDKLYEDVLEWLNIITEKIKNNRAKLESDAEKELLAMIKGFQYILEKNDIYLSRLLWNGTKNTFYKHNINVREIYEIEKLFKLYGINMEI